MTTFLRLGDPRLPERFWAKVDTDKRGCWAWQGAISQKGYGRFLVGRRNVDRRNAYAHRIAFEALVGPIPKGLTVDHLCRNRACVNPAHMEPVTNAENVRRGVASRTTTSPQNGRHIWMTQAPTFTDRTPARASHTPPTCGLGRAGATKGNHGRA